MEYLNAGDGVVVIGAVVRAGYAIPKNTIGHVVWFDNHRQYGTIVFNGYGVTHNVVRDSVAKAILKAARPRKVK